MKSVQPSSPVVRFGVFELDVRAEELRRNGLKVRLQGQPIQVLEMLLARPEGLVTREELRRKLWPESTFIDFEHGLNAAIQRLREALGDSADNPRFVETLPRRGYRFIAPVDGDAAKVSGLQALPSPLPEPAPHPQAWWNLGLPLWTHVPVVAIVAAVALWAPWRATPPKPAPLMRLSVEVAPGESLWTRRGAGSSNLA